ncbi:TCP family transcription factor 4 [Striga asiatica]|uniref:TCP family transcription factor 4 n=1 Tax=Striga asiatica TaxID=4170 RepID=A0A5A7QPG3_STRAF|nr:TCP family transcription factor 4 [Striga asiatica]
MEIVAPACPYPESDRLMEIEAPLSSAPLTHPTDNRPEEGLALIAIKTSTWKRSSSRVGRLQRTAEPINSQQLVTGAKRERDIISSESKDKEEQDIYKASGKKNKMTNEQVGDASLKWHPTHKC